MKFLNPAWLWCLAFVPVLYLALAWDERQRLRRFELFASRAVWGRIVPAWKPDARRAKARLWCLALGFILLAAARPQWGSHQETVNLTGMDIVLAVDVSNSMEVEDVVPSRLQKAKHLVRTLVEQLHGDRVGIVAFAESAYLASPLTSDLNYVLETVKILSPKMVTNQGTDLGSAIEVAQKALDRAAEVGSGSAGGATQAATASRVVIVISDGEDLEGKGQSSAAHLPEHGVRLFALGVGTQKGGPIPVRDPDGKLVSFKRDHKGESVISHFDPDGLAKIAHAGGGSYWSATTDEREVYDLVLELGAMSRSDYGEKQFVVFEERFQYPLGIAVLLLLWELGLSVSAAGRAFSFVLLFLGFAAPAQAVSLDVYRYNKKGIEAYKEGNLGQAKKDFGSAQALDPERPELSYNRGVVQMGEGDVENATESFREAARDGLRKNDSALLGKSLYNLGGALAQKGDFAGAAKSYLGAMNAARKQGDDSLQQDIRKNLELLEQQKQQQKQQQSQDQKDKKDKKDQKESKDSKDKKDQGQGKGKDDKDKDKDKDKKDKDKDKDKEDGKDKQQTEISQNEKQKFKSTQLTKDDADRVMAELKNKEMDLRSRLKKQSGNPNPNEKDW